MKILINPSFKNSLEKIKNILRPFEVVDLENFLKEILKNPKNGEKLGKTDIF